MHNTTIIVPQLASPPGTPRNHGMQAKVSLLHRRARSRSLFADATIERQTTQLWETAVVIVLVFSGLAALAIAFLLP